MLLQEINPFLRCAVQFCYSRPHSVRCAADARILYVIEGAGKLVLEDAQHPLRAGSLVLIGPGVVYGLELEQPLHLIALNFDYTWERQMLEETLGALPPEAAEQMGKTTVDDSALLSEPMVLQQAQLFRDALETICRVFQQRRCYYREEAASLLKVLLIRLARVAGLTDTASDAIADRLIRYIREHCRENLTVAQIAAHFNYNVGHINRLMRKTTGSTIHCYLTKCRMDVAKALLVSTELTVGQIAEQTGFQSAGYFSTAFLKETGCRPNDYRQEWQENL